MDFTQESGNMLGIVRDYHRNLKYSLRLLPNDLLLVLTFGRLTMQNFKIKKVNVPWPLCFIYFGTSLVIVLSLGYFSTNWWRRYSAWDR